MALKIRCYGNACFNEATNVYWEDLAPFLAELGFKVSVVNPAVPAASQSVNFDAIKLISWIV